jgi:hypothetical protein
MKKTLFISAILLFFMCGFNLFSVLSNNAEAGTIRICLDDTTCNPDDPVGSCEVAIKRCCDLQVDSIGRYFWKITDGINTYTGSVFQYNGEPLLTVNFSCINK